MAIAGIYKITSPTNKVYIGQSINIGNRFSHYRRMDKTISKQVKLMASLRKHGVENHLFSIIHELPKDVSQEILDTYEILYMDAYSNCGVELMNIRGGGKNGRHSDETKQKIKVSETGKIISEETRSKMRLVAKGRKSPMEGKVHSKESKTKMSQYHRNRPYRPLGMDITEEHKLKMKEGRMKVPHPFLGKHHSQESKDKISQNKKGCKGTRNRKVICASTGNIYESISAAAIAINIKPSTLIMQLRNGINKTSIKYL